MERSLTHQFAYSVGIKRDRNGEARKQAKVDIMDSEEAYHVSEESKIIQYCNIPQIIIFTDKL